MTFDEAHEAFLRQHLERRSGERRGRLERGHREAERLFCQNVWWPLVGSLEHLHPEYEVLHWRGQSYFCDFLWITRSVRLVIEIKGFGPHVRDMDRQKYCKELNRETFLVAMGYQVISFSYDDVAHRPEVCITLLRMVMSRFQVTPTPLNHDFAATREIIRLACTLARPLRPIDVVSHLRINQKTAIRKMQQLTDEGWFRGITGADSRRTVRYELQPSALLLL
ncbi:endonuclease domain-containing protein [Paenibacillus soyae]|uniref:Endonuclease domain-containing protein n=1 Tax=Paenibacillus soyae TaxID=2969249 RepID=A0A9X2SBW4_9BACL|nr:endonuclease domain-containing protein [Paenibacillus soyae]MCR2806063.1 endonuclease domain-containing protein [Paenibacillus soyae]